MEQTPKVLVDPPRFEYLNGRPHAKVSPRLWHAQVQLSIGQILLSLARGRGKVGTEWRFLLGEVDRTYTEFVPDVAYVSNERLSALSPQARQKPPFAPDVAVEVRSPSDHLGYFREKVARYLETGSVLVLDADPQTQTITAYSADGSRTFVVSERFEHSAAPWLVFDVAEAFSELE